MILNKSIFQYVRNIFEKIESVGYISPIFFGSKLKLVFLVTLFENCNHLVFQFEPMKTTTKTYFMRYLRIHTQDCTDQFPFLLRCTKRTNSCKDVNEKSRGEYKHMYVDFGQRYNPGGRYRVTYPKLLSKREVITP